MMYRRHAAQQPRPDRSAAIMAASFMDVARGAVLGMLMQLGIYDAAHRENRRRERHAKRWLKHDTYRAAGLNGARATARRRRQIIAGQLTVANGLVLPDMTPEERAEQRRSFAYGNVHLSNPAVTREMVVAADAAVSS